MDQMSRWIRLNTDVFLSDWLFPLSAGARLAWVCLLCYCKAQGVGGRVKRMSPLLAARQWMIGEEDVTAMLAAASAHGAATSDGTEWVIHKWTTYQEPSTDRVKRHRESSMKRDETLGNKCNTTETETETETRFKPPSSADVCEYMRERSASNPTHESERFVDFYASKGWMVGKTKMKDWKASVRNWLRDKPKAEGLRDWRE